MKFLIILAFLSSSQTTLCAPKKLEAKNLKNSFTLKKKFKPLKYRYTMYEKGNPFLPPVIEDLKPRMEIQITHELQKYFLSELRLVGTWKIDEKQKKALIMTPDGKSFTTDLRTPIGRKGGKISEIKENSITVSYIKLLENGKKERKEEFLYLEKTKEKPKIDETDKTIIISPGEENATP